MKLNFAFFIIVIILSFIAGFYYHEASDERIRFERDQCKEHLTHQNIYTNDPLIIEGIYYEQSIIK